jgi:hypothetical protein
MPLQRLADIALEAMVRGGSFTSSPAAWEDQVLYFLLVERFSDGNEKGYRDLNGDVVNTGTSPLFRRGDALNAVQTPVDAARWRDAAGAMWAANSPV